MTNFISFFKIICSDILWLQFPLSEVLSHWSQIKWDQFRQVGHGISTALSIRVIIVFFLSALATNFCFTIKDGQFAQRPDLADAPNCSLARGAPLASLGKVKTYS